jgi:hypothetical protein
MVLPVRIELTTSALPRMRSTTELRQHIGGRAALRPGAIARPHEESVWTRQGAVRYCPPMAKQDPATLAAALRANLRRRKDQARAPEPSFGTDEEGDVTPDIGNDAAGWVHEGSKKA